MHSSNNKRAFEQRLQRAMDSFDEAIAYTQLSATPRANPPCEVPFEFMKNRTWPSYERPSGRGFGEVSWLAGNPPCGKVEDPRPRDNVGQRGARVYNIDESRVLSESSDPCREFVMKFQADNACEMQGYSQRQVSDIDSEVSFKNTHSITQSYCHAKSVHGSHVELYGNSSFDQCSGIRERYDYSSEGKRTRLFTPLSEPVNVDKALKCGHHGNSLKSVNTGDESHRRTSTPCQTVRVPANLPVTNDGYNSSSHSDSRYSDRSISLHNANNSELLDSSSKLLPINGEKPMNVTSCSSISGSCSQSSISGAKSVMESTQSPTSPPLSIRSAPVVTKTSRGDDPRKDILRSCDNFFVHCSPANHELHSSTVIGCTDIHQHNTHQRRTSGYVSAENGYVNKSDEGKSNMSLRYVSTRTGERPAYPSVTENGEKPLSNEFPMAVENDRKQSAYHHHLSDRSTPTDLYPIDEKAVLSSIRKSRYRDLADERTQTPPKIISNEDTPRQSITLPKPCPPMITSNRRDDMMTLMSHQTDPAPCTIKSQITKLSSTESPVGKVATTPDSPPRFSEPKPCNTQYKECNAQCRDSGSSPVRDFHSSQFSRSRDSWQNRTREQTSQQQEIMYRTYMWAKLCQPVFEDDVRSQKRDPIASTARRQSTKSPSRPTEKQAVQYTKSERSHSPSHERLQLQSSSGGRNLARAAGKGYRSITPDSILLQSEVNASRHSRDAGTKNVKHNFNQIAENNRSERSSADNQSSLSGHETWLAYHSSREKEMTKVKAIKTELIRDASHPNTKTKYVPQSESETKPVSKMKHPERRMHRDSSVASGSSTSSDHTLRHRSSGSQSKVPSKHSNRDSSRHKLAPRRRRSTSHDSRRHSSTARYERQKPRAINHNKKRGTSVEMSQEATRKICDRQNSHNKGRHARSSSSSNQSIRSSSEEAVSCRSSSKRRHTHNQSSIRSRRDTPDQKAVASSKMPKKHRIRSQSRSSDMEDTVNLLPSPRRKMESSHSVRHKGSTPDDEARSPSKTPRKHRTHRRRSDDDSEEEDSARYVKKSVAVDKKHDSKRSTKPASQFMKPNKFDGSGSIDTFLVQFEICSQYNDWSIADKCAQLKCCLSGQAGQILWEAGDANDLTFKELTDKLRARYGAVGQKEKYLAQLRALRRRNKESLADLHKEVRRLMALAHPGACSSSLGEEIARDYFISSLADRELELKIREREPTDLDSAFRIAVRLEAYRNAYETEDTRDLRPSRHRRDRADDDLARRVTAIEQNVTSNVTNGRLETEVAELRSQLYRDRARMDEMSKEIDRRRLLEKQQLANNLRSPPGLNHQQMSPIAHEEQIEKLRKQFELEHARDESMSKELERLREQPLEFPQVAESSSAGPETPPQVTGTVANTDGNRRPPRPAVKCFKCNGLGHFARNCRSMSKVDSVQTQKPPAVLHTPDNENIPHESEDVLEQVSGAVSQGEKHFMRESYLSLKIRGKSVMCLLDTGAEATLIPSSLVRGMRLRPSEQTFRAANGTIITILGEVSFQAEAGLHRFTVTGFASDHVSDILLGIDFLGQMTALWNFAKGEIILDGYVHKLHPRSRSSWHRRVILAEETTVPSRAECVLPTYVLYHDFMSPENPESCGWVTDTNLPVQGLRISRVLVPDRSVDVPVRVLNVSKSPVVLEAGTVISELHPITLVNDTKLESCDISNEKSKVLQEIVSRVDAAVSSEYREKLFQILVENANAFSMNENDLGRTDVLEHKIDTGDARPVRQPLRRHPPAHRDAIQEHVSNMLQQGTIEPSQSPWASNVVLVKKKDGSLRCCLDYRPLNSVTRKDAYPLPRTDMCLDAMSGAKWFTTFDLRSSYHQVAVSREDADKTAFICNEGQFRFLSMPFGLCNAGATFQRLMDIIMAGLAFDVCLLYLDDIIVFSGTLDQHLDRLKIVLERLSKAGLKLKPSKCNMLQKSVEFLGHLVSGEGITAHPDKIAAVAEWPRPSTVKDVRAFLGLCSYYRRFVLNFAEIAAPLHALTSKNRKFEWNEDCQKAFERLKTALTTSPILVMPNDDDEFILDTDASDSAIGAVLSQRQAGSERVVAYASRKLSQQEKNYCVTRRELLAVVHFMKQFRHHLLGRTFVVRTDHAALQWLRRIREPVGQQARWLELMEEHTFTVVHRPGRQHGNADALSRRPCDRIRCCPSISSPNVNEEEVVCGVITAVEGATCSNDLDEENTGLQWTPEEIAKEQREDLDIKLIYDWIERGEPKPPWDDVASSSEVTKTLWRQYERLELRHNVLVRCFEKAEGGILGYQTIMPRVKREDFIKMVHGGVNGGHLGRRRTEHQVQLRAFWPGWTLDVRRILRKCDKCARYKRGTAPKQVPLKPFGAGEPFEVVSIDITGPHPRSRRGHVYILTVMDHFTKWAEAIPLRNHTAPSVANALFNQVFVRFGMPMRLLSDQGAEFESGVFKELCRMMQIEKIRTSPYRPSTNGMIERFHRTLNSMLAKTVSENQRDWCEWLPTVLAAFRASVHESTGFSPNYLMFGRENRLPVDLVLRTEEEAQSQVVTYDDFADEMSKRFRAAFDRVRQSLECAAAMRKQRYDAKVKACPFIAGQWVWYFYPRRRVRLSPKWQKWYCGPFLITRIIDSHTVVIQRSRRSKPMVVHRDKLKPCLSETPGSWIHDQTEVLSDGDHGGSKEKVEATTPSHPITLTLTKPSSPRGVARNPQNTAQLDAPLMVNERPKRCVKKPRYLSDFLCGSLQEREPAMAEAQVKDDYGTKTCVLCLAHCASSWTLDRHVQRKHPQYHAWFRTEKAKKHELRPFSANAVFRAIVNPLKGSLSTASTSSLCIESQEIASFIVENIISNVFDQVPEREMSAPRFVGADGCERQQNRSEVESGINVWSEHISCCRATIEAMLSNPKTYSLKQIRQLIKEKWPTLTNREIDLSAMFTFVTSGMMAADALALCDAEPSPLYYAQKSVVAQRALALRTSFSAWPFNEVAECNTPTNKRSQIRSADSGNLVDLLEWADCSESPHVSKLQGSPAGPIDVRCESMLYDEAIHPTLPGTDEVPNPSCNQDSEPFEVTAIDFDPCEETPSAETSIMEKSDKTTETVLYDSHDIRPSDVPGHNLGPCVEVILERLLTKELFPVSDEVTQQLDEQIRVWASEGDDTRHVHLRDQAPIKEPEKSGVVIAAFAPLVDATYGRRPTRPERPIIPGAKEKSSTKQVSKKEPAARPSCLAFEHDRLSKTIRRKLRESATSEMSLKETMKYLNQHYKTDFTLREGEISKLLEIEKGLLNPARISPPAERPQLKKLIERNALDVLTKALKLPSRITPVVDQQTPLGSSVIGSTEHEVSSTPVRSKIPSLLDLTLSPPQNMRSSHGVHRQRVQAERHLPYATKDVADRVFKRLARRHHQEK